MDITIYNKLMKNYIKESDWKNAQLVMMIQLRDLKKEGISIEAIIKEVDSMIAKAKKERGQ